MIRRLLVAELALLSLILLVLAPPTALGAGPQISLSPPSGLKGTQVTVSGTGFGASLSVTITYAGSTAASSTTSAGGSFSTSFNVPSSSTTGDVTVTATDSASNSASATFTVLSPTVSVSPPQGLRGALVTVSGSGYTASSTITLTYDLASISTTPATITASGVGAFSATLTIPASSSTGGNLVTATDSAGNSAVFTFKVVSSAISLNPTSGPRGTPASISGSGFRPNTVVKLTYDGSLATSANSSASGSFSFAYVIPYSSPFGNNTFVATDTFGNTASATFTVTSPTLRVTPTGGPVGSAATVSGSGFAPSSSVTLSYDGAFVSTSPGVISTTSGGTFTATVIVPSSTGGAHTIAAADSYGNRNTTVFKVLPSLTLAAPAATVGGTVQLSGSGFASASAITLYYDGNSVSASSEGLLATGPTGSFTAGITVPQTGALGINSVKASDVAGDSASAALNVTAGYVYITLDAAPGSTPVSSSNAFVVSYETGGAMKMSNDNGTTLRILADSASQVSIKATSSGSNGTEMWCLAVSGNLCTSAGLSLGTASQQSFTFYYYDMVLETISYAVSGGGAPQVALNYGTAPSVAGPSYATSSESAVAAAGTQGLWALKGGSIVSPVVIAGSSGERWEVTGGNSSNVVKRSTTLGITYYHQYLEKVSFSLGGGTSPTNPALTYSFLGLPRSLPLFNSSSAVWMDAGTTASLSGSLNGQGAGERWQAAQNSWTVDGAGPAPQVTYGRQFYAVLESSAPAGATVSPSSGWFDENASLSVTVTTNQGWQFEGWGPGSGDANRENPLQLTVSGPINETAVVYAGLTISTDSLGSVAYQSEAGRGSVGPGSTSTVYLPAGSFVQLQANPISPFNEFSDWAGAASLNGTQPVMAVANPVTVSAVFAFNILYVGIAVAALVVVILVVLIVRRRRAQPDDDAASDEGEPEPATTS